MVRIIALFRAVLPAAVVWPSLLAGCGHDPVSRRTVTGMWLEDAGLLKARPGSAVLATTGAVRRQLVFERNGTFRLTVCEADGRPVDPPELVTGWWKVGGGAVVLKVERTRLAAAHAGWVPESFLQMQPGLGGGPDTLDFRGRDGVRVRYRRVASGP
jgi:hypothetical protein